MRQAADEFGLKVVTELLDIRMLDVVQQYADVIQVGSRNMQNFPLLQELGKVKKPVLLKRGMHAKVNEWLLGAEYILIGGNENVILCERGIRSFDPLQRNVMDLGVISLLKELSHLPVISDPSHGTGASLRVKPMALASLAAGADGLLIEIHPNPNQALSDAQQAIDFDQFEQLYRAIQDMIPVIGNKNIQLLKREPLKLQTLS
jgi:3-deoxy-7-phosphoheptulonate synthase